MNSYSTLKNKIAEAVKSAGIKLIDVAQYKTRDAYGVAGIYTPRSKALRRELEILATDSDYVVTKVWVNGLKEVIIEYSTSI